MTRSSRATAEVNDFVRTSLPFDDATDFALATRGFVAPVPDAVKTADARPVWDARRFDVVDGEAPDSVNPSLWRQERLNGVSGLFEVVDGIYQVRGLDLSNISFIRGDTGWIVLDPLLRSQRDTYRYLHDETLRLANHGETMLEIAEQLELPGPLARTWSSRGYYGSVNHNVKAIYQRYLGFFDGNPATLPPHPPVAAAERYVDYMGGADAILSRARADHEAGDDRWVAEVVRHVVFANPDNREARELLADALTQLGYQAESGPWRNFYLTGAKELREGVKALPFVSTTSPDVLTAMPTDLLLDFVAVRLKHPDAAELTGTTLLELTDVDERYMLELSNGVLHNRPIDASALETADATITTTRARIVELLVSDAPAAAISEGEGISIQGDPSPLRRALDLLDDFTRWFNIVSP